MDDMWMSLSRPLDAWMYIYTHPGGEKCACLCRQFVPIEIDIGIEINWRLFVGVFTVYCFKQAAAWICVVREILPRFLFWDLFS